MNCEVEKNTRSNFSRRSNRAPAPEQIRPGAQSEGADSDPAGPCGRRRADADDAHVAGNGREQLRLKRPVLAPLVDRQDDWFPAKAAIIGQAHPDSLHVRGVDRGKMRADNQDLFERLRGRAHVLTPNRRGQVPQALGQAPAEQPAGELEF